MLRRTRLAPSPTGALHLGNARTFLITWALARQQGWEIALRIEDLDTPRVKPGAVEGILETLAFLGIDWDDVEGSPRSAPMVQSADLEPYRAAMVRLAQRGRAYPCELTRSQIELAASAPQEGAHDVAFPAALRPRVAGSALEFSDDAGENWRFVVEPGHTPVADQVAGVRDFDIASLVGDFVLWTKRRQPSYQLAVVVDDHRQGITDVVRGDDLLDSAARQFLLYRALGLGPEPTYWHLPLVVGEDGKRLAKRHGDTRVDFYRSRGVPAEAIIGLIARWSIPGVFADRPNARADARGLMSALEFKQRLRLDTIPRTPVTCTPEDHSWLMEHAR